MKSTMASLRPVCNRSLLIAIAVAFVAGPAQAGSSRPGPSLVHPRAGGPHPGHGSARAIWSEPPDFNGWIVASDELDGVGVLAANDFIPSEETLTRATWWGGYFYNDVPCDSGLPTPGFNLQFYNDAGCLPGDVVADLSITEFDEEYLGCQSFESPIYRWSTAIQVYLIAGERFWFMAQIKQHVTPPYGGRLSSLQVLGCGSAYLDTWYGWEWAPIGDVYGVPLDLSQEFEGLSQACCLADGGCVSATPTACREQRGFPQGPGTVCEPNPCGSPTGACCLPTGECVLANESYCSYWAGRYLGDGSACGPGPCGATSTVHATWGEIKSLYR